MIMGRSASFEETHRIAETVERRGEKLVGRGDVIVHVDPEQRGDESPAQTVNAIAARSGL